MRGKLFAFAFFFAAALALPASASPLRIRGAKVVKVRGVAGTPFQLAPEGEGWRLDLADAPPGATADLIDVTPGTPARTLTVRMVGALAHLDEIRFVGGHVYRVQLRKDGVTVAAGLVYLPPHVPTADPRPHAPSRLDFAEGERAAADDNGPAPAPKGRL